MGADPAEITTACDDACFRATGYASPEEKGNGCSWNSGDALRRRDCAPTRCVPADEEPALCRLLDSPRSPTRSDAAQRLTRQHDLVMTGGSEQIMDAAAAYCDRTQDIRPSWWASRRQ